MSRFGVTLYGAFLDKAWPLREDEPLDTVTWADVTKMFFENAKPVMEEAKRVGHVWDERAIAEVDGKLLEMAQQGTFSGILSMSPQAVEEVWRRWSFAIMGAELERRHGNALDLLVPQNAPADVRGAAVMLYILGGPARDYRRDIYPTSKAPLRPPRPSKLVRDILRKAFAPPPKKPRR